MFTQYEMDIYDCLLIQLLYHILIFQIDSSKYNHRIRNLKTFLWLLLNQEKISLVRIMEPYRKDEHKMDLVKF